MNNKEKRFIVTQRPGYKEEKSVVMSLRIDKEIQKQYDNLAIKTNRSRNEIMCLALKFALENIQLELDNDSLNNE